MKPQNNVLDKNSTTEYRIGNGLYNVNRVFSGDKTIKKIIIDELSDKKLNQ